MPENYSRKLEDSVDQRSLESVFNRTVLTDEKSSNRLHTIQLSDIRNDPLNYEVPNYFESSRIRDPNKRDF